MSDSESLSRSSSMSRNRKSSSDSSSSSHGSDKNSSATEESTTSSKNEIKQHSTEKIADELSANVNNSETNEAASNVSDNDSKLSQGEALGEADIKTGINEGNDEVEDENERSSKSNLNHETIKSYRVETSIEPGIEQDIEKRAESRQESIYEQQQNQNVIDTFSDWHDRPEDTKHTTSSESIEDRNTSRSSFKSNNEDLSQIENYDDDDDNHRIETDQIDGVDDAVVYQEKIKSEKKKNLENTTSDINAEKNEIKPDTTSRFRRQVSSCSRTSIISATKQSQRNSENASGSSSSLASDTSKPDSNIPNQRKSSFPSLKSASKIEESEPVLNNVHENGISSDSATKLPPLISKTDESVSQKKNDVTMESVENLLLGTSNALSGNKKDSLSKFNLDDVKSESASSTISSSASLPPSKSRSHSSSFVPTEAKEKDENNSPRIETDLNRSYSSVSSHQSTVTSSVGVLNPTPKQNRSKRTLRPQTRPKTPKSLKEYARNASREGMAASMKASRRPIVDENIPLSSRSRLAALDAGNLAGDSFVENCDEDQVVLTRRLSTKIKQVLLGQHLPDHLKARHLAGLFVTGVVS